MTPGPRQSIARRPVIAVIGLGYVGLPLAVSFCEREVPVIGYDHNEDLIGRLRAGGSHINDVDEDRLQSVLTFGLELTSTPSSLSTANTYIICVPTPLTTTGEPELAYVESAATAIAPHLSAGDLVVLESTSYPGTTEEVVKPLIEQGSGLRVGIDLLLAFSPERVDPGNRQFEIGNTPKIVAGWDERSRSAAAEVYGLICGEIVLASGLREAELAKLLENTYRQVNIALMNELVKFCHELDIDLYEAIRCASTKPFGFQAFYPGPGVGGHCIPIDPSYLASRVESRLGEAFRFIELAQEINSGMPQYVVDRLDRLLTARDSCLDGAAVLLLGVTYKRDVADVRESPACDIVRLLRGRGVRISYLDPFVPVWEVDGVPVQPFDPNALDDAWETFDASILVQAHTEFQKLDAARLAAVCLDTRGVLSGPSVHRL